MFGMKAEEYYLNIFFRIKVLLFLTIAAHALVFRPSVYNAPSELEGPSGHTPCTRRSGCRGNRAGTVVGSGDARDAASDIFIRRRSRITSRQGSL